MFIAGHQGLLGSALVRELTRRGNQNIVTVGRDSLDLRDPARTLEFLEAHRPDAVILCAALVGGIHANTARPAEFLFDNLMIENSVIHGAFRAGVKTLVFPGSNCMYPKEAEQPFREIDLGTGRIEPTNEPYGIAKLAGVHLCKAYARQYGVRYYSVIPASLYGPNDCFDPTQAHVLPSLLVKFLNATKAGDPAVTLWGTGLPKRELMYSDDAAAAILLTLDRYESTDPINLGVGEDIEVRELASLIREITDYKGEVRFDTTKPDGMARRLMDSSRVFEMGFRPKTRLRDGIRTTLDWLRSPGIKHRVPRDLL